MWVIGSPPCDSIKKFDNEENIEYFIHLEFCAELYSTQINEGRYFLHEQNLSSTDWNNTKMKEITQDKKNI